MQDVMPGEFTYQCPSRHVVCHQESMICLLHGGFFTAFNNATDDELYGCPGVWDALILLFIEELRHTASTMCGNAFHLALCAARAGMWPTALD